jgi:hypothetical protein
MGSQTRAARRHPDRHGANHMDVLIGYARPDEYAGQFGDCLADLMVHDAVKNKRVGYRLAYISGPRISEARNGIVRTALGKSAPEVKYVWMIDADMAFPRTHLDDMLAVMESHDDMTILGSLAFAGGRSPFLNPVIYAETPGSEPRRFELVKDYPDNTLTRVAATGAACLLIRRDALIDIWRKNSEKAHPWFEETTNGEIQYGEDVTFCMRAREAGHEVYVHTGMEVGHMKTMPLHSGLYKILRNLDSQQRAEYEASFNRALGQAS